MTKSEGPRVVRGFKWKISPEANYLYDLEVTDPEPTYDIAEVSFLPHHSQGVGPIESWMVEWIRHNERRAVARTLADAILGLQETDDDD